MSGRADSGAPDALTPMLWFLLALLPADVAGPSELVTVHRERPREATLAWVEERLEEETVDPALYYLMGRLLEEEGQERRATRAYSALIRRHPGLAPRGRLRLAEIALTGDHPETAAGLLVSLLAPRAPPEVRSRAADLLDRSLEGGGDCRLLARIALDQLSDPVRRLLVLCRARCELRQGERARGREELVELLEEDVRDDVGLRAAEELDRLVSGSPDPGTAELLARSFFRHRRFERAVGLLEPLLSAPEGSEVDDEDELRYLLGRSRFWLGEYDEAVEIFAELARTGPDRSDRSRAAYQEGRALELSGRILAARAAFARAAGLDPMGSWAGPGLLSALRLVALSGNEREAKRLLGLLDAFPQHRRYAVRAGLFLTADALGRGEAAGAQAWLLTSRKNAGDTRELDYWDGRIDLDRRRFGAAADHLAPVVVQSPWHPLARDAVRRLGATSLDQVVDDRIRRWESSTDPEDRLAAWLLLPSGSPRRARVERSLFQTFTADRRWAPFVALAPAPPESWPFWKEEPDGPGEELLALGRWDEVPFSVILEHFPPTEPSLAFAASRKLEGVGRIKDSLYLVESLARGSADAIPVPFLPVPFRKALYPTPYRQTVEEASRRHGIEPALLYAIMREESRFDPRALSPASARGLTQMVLPTARPLAESLGMTPFSAEDLFRPEVAIELGAAHLAELARTLDQREERMIAAYNAGVPQTERWVAYLRTDEIPEFLAKVGFRQTRAYLQRVLTSLAAYRVLYPGLRRVEIEATRN
ncbi:MAG: transglycosylase SLT domain-containing protein [Thermoanaerobaculia bacterium]|nr:transglycosylase SLT domain-containing protein [Thermoanaerobaculia bacterium]